MTVSATTETRKQYTGNSGYTTSTDFTAGFKYLSTSEIKVTHTNTTTGTDTPYTEGTHYSVHSGASAASVTIRFLTSYVPTATTEYITIFRETTFDQLTDYTEGSTLDAETLEQNFDKGIMLIQQVNNNLTDLNISFTGTNDFHTTAAAASDISTSKANRKNKILAFDDNGDIQATQEIGTNRGDWVTGATYQLRDLVKQASASDTSTQNNIYICTTAHSPSTGSYLTQNDSSNWTLILEVAGAASSASTASGSASTATTQAGLASDHRADAAKYAVTAENSSFTLTATNSGTSGLYSAKHYQEKAKEWAGTGTSHPLVTDDSGSNIAGEYSAKAWASKGSGTVDGSTKSAKLSASDAATSETNAAASAAAAAASAAAVASAFDSFDDKFLGSMADSASASSASTTGTWAKNASVIAVASASGIVVGQEVTGTGIPTDANVISIDGTNITISENMVAAGSGVSLTFTGQGVYGAFNGSKDGPATDNDGNALVNGALYFNTTDGDMRVYATSSGTWITASAAQNATVLDYTYTLSGSDATISGSDDNSATLSFSNQESVDVFLNGVKLVPKIGSDANDYHLDTSNTVTLASTAVSGDVILVRVYKTFTVGDAVPASSGGTFSGNVAYTGNIQVDDIIEKSADHGVEIDGVTLKDGGLTTTGNVGVGVAPASNDGWGKIVEIGGTAGGELSLNHSDSSATQGIAQVSFTRDSVTLASVNGVTGTDTSSAPGEADSGITKGELNFRTHNGTSNATRMTVESNGNVTVEDGDLVIGTAGKGIDFSSASGSAGGSSSALLDDYEEGTWTPTISGATLNANGTGFYIKVGNVVSIFAAFGNVTVSSVSGYSYVTGFPFTTNFQSVGHTGHNNMSTVSQFYIGSGSTSALATADNSTGTLNAWNAGSSKYMFFQATYRTT